MNVRKALRMIPVAVLMTGLPLVYGCRWSGEGIGIHRNENRIGTLKLRDAPAMLGGNAGSGSAR
jgi:hypothetical protein